MVSFFLCLAVLICGYLFYGKFVDQVFNPDDRETPAVAINDGIDYVVLPQWKLFMIQLLNIAGSFKKVLLSRLHSTNGIPSPLVNLDRLYHGVL